MWKAVPEIMAEFASDDRIRVVALVNRVVPTPDIESYVRDDAATINAPLTINSVKRRSDPPSASARA
jgi:hypothetical protein